MRILAQSRLAFLRIKSSPKLVHESSSASATARWMTPRLLASTSSLSSSSAIDSACGPRTSLSVFRCFASSADAQQEHPSSKRALNAVKLLPSYLTDARSVEQYHPTNAPNGALQLGVAESKMLEDLLVPALNMPIEVAGDCIYYQQTHGRLPCRESIASYMESLLDLPKSRLDVEGLVLGSGCNAVLENLCICLAEPGETVMIPTPYYAAFEFDLVARASLHVEPVPTQEYTEISSSDGNQQGQHTVDPSKYYPTAAALTAAYERSSQAGHTPKILLLSHPHNPLGVCYPKHVLEECIDWCRTNMVHLVSDEIYAGSIYKDDKAGFQSILQVAADNKNGEDGSLGLGPYVHWVYAMSKDFALSGLRVGVAYSENKAIRLPMQKLNDLCQISSQTQVWVDTLMKKHTDEDDKNSPLWVDEFRQENHRRLRARCDALTKCLEDCKIPYLPATSGLFCWVDLSAYLPKNGSDAERERALYLEMVKEFGLLLTPGNSMRNEEPGFFRIVFTAATDQEFELGLQRLRHFANVKGQEM